MVVSQSILSNIIKNNKAGKRTNIILDLDNTIISSVKYSSISDEYRKIRAPHYIFNSEYIIFERPGTQRFLDFLFRHFDVSVWSAASKDYVHFIVNKVIARGRRVPKIVLHSEHCSQSSKMYNPNSPKDLRYIYDRFPGFNSANTFIIDDLDAVYDAQRDNCIHIFPFDIEKTTKIKDIHLDIIQKCLQRTFS